MIVARAFPFRIIIENLNTSHFFGLLSIVVTAIQLCRVKSQNKEILSTPYAR